ncbi:MAG: hypothetical protein HRT45_14610 [Bdellovibrionales bacterium]|nr:hypothetical protein [Bdellovibrionales bacterium]
MIRDVVLQDLDSEIDLYWSNGAFYRDQALTESLEVNRNQPLSRRIEHTVQWCIKNSRSFTFEQILFGAEQNEAVSIRPEYCKVKTHQVKLDRILDRI